MKAKGLLILSLTTGLFVFAALNTLGVGSDEADASTATSEEDGKVFEGLLAQVNDVRSIEVRGGGESLTLRQTEGGWGLAERGDYTVEFNKVKELVVKVAELEIDEVKTARPENHAKLGVEDPSDEESSSRLLILRDGEKNSLAELIIGDTKPTGFFVRRGGEDQVYRCKGSLSVDTTPKTWIEKELLRIANDRVQSVNIKHQDGEEVVVSRDPENPTQFFLENAPLDRSEKYAGVATGVGTALSYLSLEDVRPMDGTDLYDTPICNTTYTCEDGLIIEVLLSEWEGDRWINIKALNHPVEVDTIGPVAGGPDETGEEPIDPAADAAQVALRVEAEVDEINAKLSSWAFKIVDYKADVIGRRMEDLLEELPVEGEDAAPVDDLGGLEGLPAIMSEPTQGSLSLEDILGTESAEELPVLEDVPAPAGEGVEPAPNTDSEDSETKDDDPTPEDG